MGNKEARQPFFKEEHFLLRLGLSSNQAIAFCEWLDERQPCGITAPGLVRRVLQWHDRELMTLQAALDVANAWNAALIGKEVTPSLFPD